MTETKGHVLGMMQAVAGIAEKLEQAGQTTVYTGASDGFRVFARIAREALTRNHGSMELLRLAVLSGAVMGMNDPEVAADFSDLIETLSDYLRVATSTATPPGRH